MVLCEDARMLAAQAMKNAGVDPSHTPKPMHEVIIANQLPGKPFLQKLIQALDNHHAQKQQQTTSSSAQVSCIASGEAGHPVMRRRRLSSSNSGKQLPIDVDIPLVLELNPACTLYLQSLFEAMLRPQVQDSTGLVTQWRLNPSFLETMASPCEDQDPSSRPQSSSSVSSMGAAHPDSVLRLAGHLLELRALALAPMVALDMQFPVPSECNLAIFPSLQSLRLDGCDLASIKQVGSLQTRLVDLSFRNRKLTSLSSLLCHDRNSSTTKRKKATDAAAWPQLQILSIVNCELQALDEEALSLLPSIRQLNLSQNALTQVTPLHVCRYLTTLNLSHNSIRSAVGLQHVLPSIQKLDLSHNQLTSASGLEQLHTLEVLNLASNCIQAVADVAPLASLPALHSLILCGNPLAQSRSYRGDLRHLLSHEVTLDETPWLSPTLHEFMQGVPTETSAPPHVSPRRLQPVAAVERTKQPDASSKPTIDGSIAWTLLLSIVLGCWMAMRSMDFEAVMISVITSACVLWSAQCLVPSMSTKEHKHPPLRAVSRRLSARVAHRLYDQNLSDEMDHRPPKHTTVALDVLQTSLQKLHEAGENAPAVIFLDVCAKIQTLLSFFNDDDDDGDQASSLAFATKGLSHGITLLETRFHALKSDSCVVLRQLLVSEDPTTSTSTSSQEKMLDVLDLLQFAALIFSHFERQSGLMHDQIIASYQQVFGARHAWWTQAAITACMMMHGAHSTFFSRLRRGNDRIVGSQHPDAKIVQVMQEVGMRLEAVAQHLKEFAHHEHVI